MSTLAAVTNRRGVSGDGLVSVWLLYLAPTLRLRVRRIRVVRAGLANCRCGLLGFISDRALPLGDVTQLLSVFLGGLRAASLLECLLGLTGHRLPVHAF